MESSSSHYFNFVACLCNAVLFIVFSVGLDRPLTALTCSFYFGFVGLGIGMVEAIYNRSTTKKFFWMTATTFMILCGTEEYMGDSVLYRGLG
jgi:NAD/NADP transhydrogenase beta subunit